MPATIKNGSHCFKNPPKLKIKILLLKNSFVLKILPDVFGLKKYQEAQLDHVPRARVAETHPIERASNMRVTIITA